MCTKKCTLCPFVLPALQVNVTYTFCSFVHVREFLELFHFFIYHRFFNGMCQFFGFPLQIDFLDDDILLSCLYSNLADVFLLFFTVLFREPGGCACFWGQRRQCLPILTRRAAPSGHRDAAQGCRLRKRTKWVFPYFSCARDGGQEQLISNGGRFKPVFFIWVRPMSSSATSTTCQSVTCTGR